MNQYGFRSSLEGDIHSGSDWKPYDSWTYEKKQRYERACEAYFLSQYEKRIAHLKTYGAANHEALTNEPFTPYPLDAIIPLQELPNYEFLSFLLNDSDLYLSLLPRPPSSEFVSQQDHLWHYLWEAFGVHPHELTKIYKLWGVFSKAAHLIDVQEAVDRRLYLEHPSGYSFVQLQKHLLRLIDQNVPESMELRHINFRMEQFRNDLMNSEQVLFAKIVTESPLGRMPLPMITGLQTYLSNHFLTVARGYIKFSWDNLKVPKAPTEDVMSSCSDLGERKETILFSTGGTGKTRKILNTLCVRDGVYMVAPSVEPTTDSSILQPNRSGASKDTLSLLQDLSRLGHALWPEVMTQFCCASLLLARSVTFQLFQDHATSRQYLKSANAKRERLIIPSDLRRAWMRLQISCTQRCDPFDAIWRFIRIMPTYPLWSGEAEYDYDISRRLKLWFIDESQTAFASPQTTAILLGICEGVRRNHANFVLSGTSLELVEATAFVENLKESSYLRNYGPLEVIFISEMIDSTSSFSNFLEKHVSDLITEQRAISDRAENSAHLTPTNLFTLAGRKLDFDFQPPQDTNAWDIVRVSSGAKDAKNLTWLRTAIENEAPRFFGRYRWSTLFIEQLLKSSAINSGELSEGLVSNAASIAADNAKDALQYQMNRVANAEWFSDLLWVAICADVLSQARIIEKSAAKLISEGFALIKDVKDGTVIHNDVVDLNSVPSSQKIQEIPDVTGVLCEPLAVEAVMEYLRAYKYTYEKYMHDFFRSIQVDDKDQGSIGKLAEFVFAEKLDNFLPPSDDPIASSRRGHLYRIFEGAERLEKTRATRPSRGGDTDYRLQLNSTQYSQYRLHEPTHSQSTHSKETAEWLVREGRSEHTRFHFPRKEGGPDLLFSLTNGTEKVLCAIQFKTGANAHQNAEISSALATLVKDGWQTSFRGQVIFIYVAPSVDIKENVFANAIESLKDKAADSYFCHCDKGRSADVWGQSFVDLLEKMKQKSIQPIKPKKTRSPVLLQKRPQININID